MKRIVVSGLTLGMLIIIVLFVLFSGIVFADFAPKVIPPATDAMQHPEFWIGRITGGADRIMLTPEQIRELNEKNRTLPYETTDINGNPYSIANIVARIDNIGIQFLFENPLKIQTFTGDSLRARFKSTRGYFQKGTYFDRRQVQFTDEMKQELLDKTAFDSIPDTIIPMYGILTAYTLNRILPTNLPALGGACGWLDLMQSASFDYGTPVAVLHASADIDWYYVRGETAFGWVPASQVAFGTPAEIGKLAYSDNFIVVTEHKIPLYANKAFSAFITDVYMGSRLALRKKDASGYEVLVPYRNADGSLTTVSGWVKPDADVTIGYQPFTQRNILNTIFNLLYRPYGWADSNYERDCCGTIRAVYKTFGIFLPRWTTHQLHSGVRVLAFPENTPKERKYQLLDSCEPAVSLVGNQGHICMYLGKVDGTYYVIHQSGYSYHTDNGTEMMVRRVNVNDTELEGGSNIDSWTEIGIFCH